MDWAMLLYTVGGFVLAKLFPGLKLPAFPTTPAPVQPATPAPINNTPRVEDVISLLLTELRRLQDRLDRMLPVNPSNPTGPA